MNAEAAKLGDKVDALTHANKMLGELWSELTVFAKEAKENASKLGDSYTQRYWDDIAQNADRWAQNTSLDGLATETQINQNIIAKQSKLFTSTALSKGSKVIDAGQVLVNVLTGDYYGAVGAAAGIAAGVIATTAIASALVLVSPLAVAGILVVSTVVSIFVDDGVTALLKWWDPFGLDEEEVDNIQVDPEPPITPPVEPPVTEPPTTPPVYPPEQPPEEPPELPPEQPPVQPPKQSPVQPPMTPPVEPPEQPTEPIDGPNSDDFLDPDLTSGEPTLNDGDLNENGIDDFHVNDAYIEGTELVLELDDGSQLRREIEEGDVLDITKVDGELTELSLNGESLLDEDGNLKDPPSEGDGEAEPADELDEEEAGDRPEESEQNPNEEENPEEDEGPDDSPEDEDEKPVEQGGEGGGAGDPAGKGSGGSGRSIPRDPLVLDLDADGVELTQLAGSNAYFDLNGDGFATRTSWLSGDDGFLAFDRNKDGIINNIEELFGSPERTGYEELSDLDSNLDGVIDSADDSFSELTLWQDKNGDGVSQAAEMQSLSDAGIVNVSLNYQDVVSQQGSDGQIARQGTFTRVDGSQGLAAETTGIAADVLFSSSPTYTRFVGTVSINPDVLAVGNIKGYGQMPDLHQAMSLNENLKNYVLQLFAAPSADTLLAGFEELLVKWANVEGITLDEIDPGHRINLNPATGLVDFRLAGESFTPEQLGVIKKYAGMDVLQLGDGQWRENGKIVTTGSFYREAYQELSRNLLIKLAVANGLVEDVALNISYDSQSDLLSIGTAPSAGLFTSMLSDMEANKNDAPFVAKHWISLAALLEVKPSISTELSDAINSFVIDHADIESLKAIFENSMFDLLALDSFIGTSGNDSITGSALNDLLVGFSGNDVLYAGDGDDDVIGNDGNDTLYGGSGSDHLFGGAGDDNLYADGGHGLGNGDDILEGGAGNDYLRGGIGSETYVFGLGDGQDTINNDADSYHGRADTTEGKQDVLEFKEGIAAADVSVSRVGDNLVLKIAGTTDQVTIQSYFNADGYSSRGYAVDAIRFADGTQWDVDTVKAKILVGAAENDILIGFSGNDTIRGGLGDDQLTGGGGSDIYVFGSNDGIDTINNYDTASESVDIALFEHVSFEDLWFSKTGNNLEISIAGTDSKATVANWYGGANYQLDRIETGSSVLMNSQVEKLVAAMATFDVPVGVGSIVSSEAKEELSSVLAEAWQAK